MVSEWMEKILEAAEEEIRSWSKSKQQFMEKEVNSFLRKEENKGKPDDPTTI